MDSLNLIDKYLVQKKEELKFIGSLLDSNLNDKEHFLGLSEILSYSNRIKLLKLCNFEKEIKWKLLYRASRDGFQSKNFHDKCDGKVKTLTVIKSKEGFIFGGYASEAWSSANKYIPDKKALIFSLENEKNHPLVLKCTDEKYAIYGGSCYGPCFGYSSCLYVGNNSDLANFSFSDLSYNYKLESAEKTEARTFLAGSEFFTIKDIEVFQVQN